jgi:hypothetical protein
VALMRKSGSFYVAEERLVIRFPRMAYAQIRLAVLPANPGVLST